MTVLDAYVIAYLRGEPSDGEVADLLREPTQLTAVNAAEVCDQMTRVFGSDPDARAALGPRRTPWKPRRPSCCRE